jgi:outer membrane immunogenic protein
MKGDHDLDSYFQSTKLDWIATAAAHIGYAFNNSLIYVKGGGAWDRGNYDMTLGGISYSDKVTRSGWMIGGGWAYGFAPHWSVKLEYNYIKFGYHDAWWNYLYRTPPNPWTFHIDQAINVVKAGLNYHF